MRYMTKEPADENRRALLRNQMRSGFDYIN